MAKFPSFIFSFKRAQISDWPRRELYAGICAVVVVAFAECGARYLSSLGVLDGWNYWGNSVAAKYHSYDALARRGELPGVVVAGDSTVAYGFSPPDFDRQIGLERASFNFGVLGNFPVAFDQSFTNLVLNDTQKSPEILVLMFARGAFVTTPGHIRTEKAILDSPVVRSTRGEFVLADYVHLMRLWKVRARVRDWLLGRPIDRLEESLSGYRRQGNHGEATSIEGKDPDDRLIDRQRLALLERCLTKANTKGTKVVVVIPPEHSTEREGWSDSTRATQLIAGVCSRCDVMVLDFTQEDFDNEMFDHVHLDRNGAIRFSAMLAERLEPWLHDTCDDGVAEQVAKIRGSENAVGSAN